MSLPHDKAPVADAIGAFSFVRLRCGGQGHRPLAAAGLGLRGSYPLQRFLDPECHCSSDDLTQLRWFDRLGAALDQNVAKDNRRFVAELRFPGGQFVALFPELFQGIDRIVLAGHVSPFRPLGLWSLDSSSATACGV